MNIQDVCDYFNFFINKYTGAYFSVGECVSMLDRGQIALYSDYKNRYATSQLIKDALSPFKETYNFTTQISGVVVVPATNYLDLLSIQIYYQISNRTVYAPVKLYNEDELANQLNSQTEPTTITSPIGEQVGKQSFRLYPVGVYNGNVSYLRRPVAPVFGYTIVSGRVVVYDPNTSVQLEWRETEINELVLKALSIAGINLRDGELEQFAEAKTQGNYVSVNRL